MARNPFSEFDLPAEALVWLKTNLISMAGAFAVLVIGVILARLLSRGVEKALSNSERFDATVATFLSNLVKYALWVLVGVTVLTQFGVQTTSILAALGGVALAIGLALQGTLSNVAAGVMILILKPFRVGEAINVGQITAVVQAIGLFSTELKQFDGIFVMIPNAELWNKPIINFNRHPTRRFELKVGISYSDSMAEAREVLLEMAAADKRVLDDPTPVAFVASLDESSVGIGLRVWVRTEDYLDVSWALTEAAKARFDDRGLSIPFPQREIRTAPS